MMNTNFKSNLAVNEQESVLPVIQCSEMRLPHLYIWKDHHHSSESFHCTT